MPTENYYQRLILNALLTLNGKSVILIIKYTFIPCQFKLKNVIRYTLIQVSYKRALKMKLGRKGVKLYSSFFIIKLNLKDKFHLIGQ